MSQTPRGAFNWLSHKTIEHDGSNRAGLMAINWFYGKGQSAVTCPLPSRILPYSWKECASDIISGLIRAPSVNTSRVYLVIALEPGAQLESGFISDSIRGIRRIDPWCICVELSLTHPDVAGFQLELSQEGIINDEDELIILQIY